MSDNPSIESATLGGCCFWCLEAVYDEVEGVVSVESGYAGGNPAQPSYQQVCTGTTGHAEVVQVTFDTRRISYREILEIFFSIHNPTTLNRQGADVGTQYRSVIFYHNEQQRKLAEEYKRKLNSARTFQSPIVTEIAQFEEFFPAED